MTDQAKTHRQRCPHCGAVWQITINDPEDHAQGSAACVCGAPLEGSSTHRSYAYELMSGPTPSKPKKRPRDPNQLAKSIVGIATGEDEDRPPTPEEEGKDPAAVSLGRRGGLKGGKARAKKLTPEQRTEIAKLAAQARWKKSD